MIGNKIIINNKLVNITNLTNDGSTAEMPNILSSNLHQQSNLVKPISFQQAQVNHITNSNQNIYASANSKLQAIQVVPPTIISSYIPSKNMKKHR